MAALCDDWASMNRERVWILCPSYTDVIAFTMLRKRILEVMETGTLLDREIRFVLVDDTGDNDEQIEELDAYDDVRVVSPPFNLGHQRAIVYGLRTIEPLFDDADIIVTMDADGEDRPEDLPHLLVPLLHETTDRRTLCVARRTKRRETVRFKAMYFVFRLVFRTLTGMTVRSGNYAAYRGWLARRMLQHPYFDLCYSSSLISLDIPVTQIPCPRG